MSTMQALASEIWSSASTPIQEAAITAYSANAELAMYVQSCARLHGYTTSRLYEMLLQIGVECPRPAGGFYLYPDFAPWRSTLEKHGITTGDQLARFLLDEWDIATLPGTAFGDRPDALRLRVATSMLYAPEGAQSGEERDKAMWEMIAQAGTWTSEDEIGQGARLELPMLERVQKRLGEFIASLGE